MSYLPSAAVGSLIHIISTEESYTNEVHLRQVVNTAFLSILRGYRFLMVKKNRDAPFSFATSATGDEVEKFLMVSVDAPSKIFCKR